MKNNSNYAYHIDYDTIKKAVRYSIILFLTFIFSAVANGFSQDKVSLNLKNLNIAQILDEIEASSEYKFIYNVNVFDFDKKTSITVKDKSIKFVLDMIFNNQLDYEVVDKKVLLKKKVKTNVISEVEDEIVQRNGVTILGKKNILNKLPVSASNLYAKNLFNFVLNLYDKKNNKININLEDEIINKTLVK